MANLVSPRYTSRNCIQRWIKSNHAIVLLLALMQSRTLAFNLGTRVATFSTSRTTSSTQLGLAVPDILAAPLSTASDWGVARTLPLRPLPQTLNEVAKEAVVAIGAALSIGNNNGDKHIESDDTSFCLDPNTVQNAVFGDNLYGRRPVRSAWDAGRIGIELDGLEYVSGNENSSNSNIIVSGGNDRMSPSRALCRVSLYMALKLARTNDNKKTRPVVLYFNTVQQALRASKELQIIKYQQQQQYMNTDGDCYSDECFDSISIKCSSRGEDIPSSMRHFDKKESSRTRVARLSRGTVDADRGLVLMVQPTDYNKFDKPPGPSLDAVEALQRVAAQASVHGLPLVVISPRFLANYAYASESIVSANKYYFHSNSNARVHTDVFGGIEPPHGPLPWILRDFLPPVYCYVGQAVTLQSSRQSTVHDDSDSGNVSEQRVSEYTGIALQKSIMNTGHAWYIYATKRRRLPLYNVETGDLNEKKRLDAEYLACTQVSAGRPTRDILRRIFAEFASFKED